MALIRTYPYGLLAPDKVDLVAHHVNERNLLWNRLAELHQQTSAAFARDVRAKCPDVAALQDAYKNKMASYSAARRSAAADDVGQQRRATEEAYQALRKAIDASPSAKDVNAHHSKQFFDAANSLARHSILWWPNANSLLNEFFSARSQALSKGAGVRARAVDGTGALFVTFQGGLPAVHLFGKCPNVEILGQGREVELRFTVTTYGKKRSDKEIATFPMAMHRPLPAGGFVRRARLGVRRVGLDLRYEAQFMCEVPEETFQALPTDRRVAAMDLGWRITQEGMRVATIRDEAGEVRHLHLPRDWILSADYCSDLQVVLQKALDEILQTARAEVSAQGNATALSRMILSGDRVSARGVMKLIHSGAASAVPPAIAAWSTRNSRMYDELEHLLLKLARRREDIYRNFVLECCKDFHTLAMEKLDLKRLAGRLDTEEWIDQQRNYSRRLASLSTLISYFKESHRAGKIQLTEHNAAFTSRKCHACGHINESSELLVLACSGCGAVWDQDENTCLNLLA